LKGSFQIAEKENTMSETNEDLTERENETELDDAELDAVAGGAAAPRDPQSGLPTGQ
jgi:hypothetical protein